MKLLILNGPNLNLLGLREPALYGRESYADLCEKCRKHAETLGISVEILQSNHEGVLIDEIQKALGVFDGIVFNPAGYTHTSVALLDALLAVGLPTVEVHLSDLKSRENFRQLSYAGMACVKTFMGQGLEGYRQAILYLKDYLAQRGTN